MPRTPYPRPTLNDIVVNYRYIGEGPDHYDTHRYWVVMGVFYVKTYAYDTMAEAMAACHGARSRALKRYGYNLNG
jgi:hypothetical protein